MAQYEKKTRANLLDYTSEIEGLKLTIKTLQGEKVIPGLFLLIEQNALNDKLQNLKQDLVFERRKNEDQIENLFSERERNEKLENQIQNLQMQKASSSIEVDRLQSQISQLKIQVDGQFDAARYNSRQNLAQANDYRSGYDHASSQGSQRHSGLYISGNNSEGDKNDAQKMRQKNDALQREFEQMLKGQNSQGSGFYASNDPSNTN